MIKNNILNQAEYRANNSINTLQKLRYCTGNASEFWPSYVENIALFLKAQSALLLIPNQDEWSSLVNWPKEPALSSGLLAQIAKCAAKAQQLPGELAITKFQASYILSYYLFLENDKSSAVICFTLSAEQFHCENENTLRNYFEFITDIPIAYFKHQQLITSGIDNTTAFEVLALLTELQNANYYKQSTITLCNEISNKFSFDNVYFGWVEKGYVKLHAMSHSDKFNRKMQYSRAIENAMEEAQEQDHEIQFPSNSIQIKRNHIEAARQTNSLSLLSLPLRHKGAVIAVISVQRNTLDISEDDVVRLRILCDQVTQRLVFQKHKSRNLFARAIENGRQKLNKVLGIEHSLTKLVISLIVLFIVYISIATMPYRIEAPFVLKTDNVHFITAPFDAYVQTSNVKPGDNVLAGQPIIQLNIEDLLLQKANLQVDLNKAAREAEKYRATQSLADMKIANTRKQQAEIHISQLDRKLDKSTIKAQQQGLIIEGDLSRMLGAPVKKGDILLKISPLDQLYAELDLEEIFIHEIQEGLTGQIIFQSQPKRKYPIIITQIYPTAVAKSGKNIFTLKADLTHEAQQWWHPGMSGIAKIKLAPRNIMWILTHRTIDALRMFVWL
ncbi:MAG: efflux RND transporter periplasmic adaptor subunit [Oceanospirillaceae bacterium]